MKLDYQVPEQRGRDSIDAVVAAWIGSVLGVLFTVPLIILAILSMQGQAIFARAVFPFPFLLAYRVTDLSPVAFMLALLQWPIFGGILGWLLDARRYWVIATVAAVHAIGICMTFRL